MELLILYLGLAFVGYLVGNKWMPRGQKSPWVTRIQMAAAYASAGQSAVSGFWAVLEGLVPESERSQVIGLRG